MVEEGKKSKRGDEGKKTKKNKKERSPEMRQVSAHRTARRAGDERVEEGASKGDLWRDRTSGIPAFIRVGESDRKGTTAPCFTLTLRTQYSAGNRDPGRGTCLKGEGQEATVSL